MSVVCNLDWEAYRMLIEKHVPGGASQEMQDADTF